MADDDDTAPTPSPRPNGAVTGPVDPRLVTYDASELRETLSMMGTLVASMSDRVDGQATTLDRLMKTAAETRAAAFHAKAQMDMAPVAKALSESMDRNIGPLANQLSGLQRDIATDRAKTKAAFDDLFRSTSDVLEQRRRQVAGLKASNWIPLMACLALVLVLATAAFTPWLVGKLSSELLCSMAGGAWYASGACTF